MKNLKNTASIVTDHATPKISGDKHDANLQQNSTLYFQVGLIVCLLATYGLLEMQFEKTLPSMDVGMRIEDPTEILIPIIEIEKEIPESKPIIKQTRIFSDVQPIIKPDNFVIPDMDIITPDQLASVTPAKVGDIPSVIDPVAPINPIFDMIGVELVPIYPGCESARTNEERRKCMSENLTKLIQRRFDKDLASKLGLAGTQKIYVQFKIDELGNVTDIKTRAPHRELEKEAKRVTEKIPQMIPGKQRDRAVSVLYNLPIVFDVKN